MTRTATAGAKQTTAKARPDAAVVEPTHVKSVPPNALEVLSARLGNLALSASKWGQSQLKGRPVETITLGAEVASTVHREGVQ